jgi:hypothetical protein
MAIFDVTVSADPGTQPDGTTGAPGTLSWALAQANATPGPHTINIMVDVDLTGPLSPIFNSVTINGKNGHTIDANHATRIFMVGVDLNTLHDVSWFGSPIAERPQVAINDLTLANGLAQGGTGVALIALLANPNNPESEHFERSARDGARALGWRLLVLKAGTPRDIDEAFATLAEQGVNAVIVAPDPFLSTRSRQLAIVGARHAIPLMSSVRELPAAGGLISYGNSVTDAYRRAGIYAGRILKGATPPDMPVDRATKFELVINLGTAKTFGLEIPPTLLARADEVIE